MTIKSDYCNERNQPVFGKRTKDADANRLVYKFFRAKFMPDRDLSFTWGQAGFAVEAA